MEQFGETLAVLHRHGVRQPLDKFYDWAFEVLKSAVEFDAGFWGVGTWAANGEPVMRNQHVHGMPAEKMLDDWNAMKSDAAHQAVLEQLSQAGRSVAFAPEILKDDPFCRKYGICAVVTNCVLEPTTRMLHIFSFYRLHGGAAFDERERRLHQALAPHLFDIERDVWLRQFSGATAPCDPTATDNQAVCDREGTLRLTQKGFMQAILAEWPSWKGPIIPDALLEPVRNGQKTEVVGARTVVGVVPRHQMMVLSARPRGAVDVLSPREKLVARGWGRGRTYKEIAATLGIAPATVRNHVSSIYAKLGTTGRRQVSEILGEHN